MLRYKYNLQDYEIYLHLKLFQYCKKQFVFIQTYLRGINTFVFIKFMLCE
jgi:hypothetical protein